MVERALQSNKGNLSDTYYQLRVEIPGQLTYTEVCYVEELLPSITMNHALGLSMWLVPFPAINLQFSRTLIRNPIIVRNALKAFYNLETVRNCKDISF